MQITAEIRIQILSAQGSSQDVMEVGLCIGKIYTEIKLNLLLKHCMV